MLVNGAAGGVGVPEGSRVGSWSDVTGVARHHLEEIVESSTDHDAASKYA